MPRQRRLGLPDKLEAEELFRLKVNKKLLQQHLTNKTGKVITLKDLTNVQTGLHQSDSDGNNLEELVTRLKGIDGK